MEDQNLPATPPAPTTEPVLQKPRYDRARTLFICLVLALLLGAGAYLFAQYYSDKSSDSGAVNYGQFTIPLDNQNNGENPVPTDSTPTDPNVTIESWITVAWEPKLLVQEDACPVDVTLDCKDYTVKNYFAGTVKDGKFANQKLYIQENIGLGTSFDHYIIQDGRKILVLGEKIGIRGIDDLPKEIDFPNKSGYKLKSGFVGSQLFANQVLVKKLFTHPTLGDFYLSEEGCIVFELPDHTAMSYDFDPSFLNNQNGEVSATINGKANTESYTFNTPTCAAGCYYWSVVKEEDLKPGTRLQIIGQMANGESIFGLKDSNDQALKDIYNDKNTVAYYPEYPQTGGQQETSKYTYAQFLSLNPLFYWQDPLGRWIEFRNNKITIAAEMCKPVIYLYPTRTSEVHVKVNPNGGFTHTEPVYNNGWTVLATPEGHLTEVGTGKQYDYLFWEGLGLAYPKDERGFVVKQKDLNVFFDEKLVQLGLEGREITDFKEYWLSRLTDKPYYKISFVNKAAFDKVAPLSVSGNPKNIIRVMMTAEGQEKFTDIAPQNLSVKPSRSGFTVVEWGGVLWQ